MTATTLDQHAPVGAPPHRRRSVWLRAGLDPRGLDDGPVLGHRPRPGAHLPLVGGLGAAAQVGRDHGRRDADGGADRLPRRHRGVRLLGPLRDRVADRAGGPLDARRAHLVRLFPPEHRPQGDRDPVPRDDDLLLRRRRADGDDLPRRARPPRDAVRRQPDLQRPDLGARGADDLPVRHPRVRRPGELRDPADDRRAGHGLPAPERALVLAAADRRLHDAALVHRSGRCVRDRVDELRAVGQRSAPGAGVLQHGRPVGGGVVDHDRAQLPGHDHHHARARG